MDIRRVTESFSVSPQIAPGDLDGEEPGQPTGDEIEAAAEAAGLTYWAIPVSGGFSNIQIATMAERLSEVRGPVFAYCRTGTRSTLLWALAEAMRGGDPEAIAAAAAGAGYDIAPVRAAVEQLAASSES